MLIKKGDILIPKVSLENLTLYKEYMVVNIVDSSFDKSITIIGDDNINWSFGQIGYFDPWTNFFYTKLEWERIKKLNYLNSEL